MKHTNYEIKAKSSEEQQNEIRDFLKTSDADFKGIDHQIDTYFKVPEGRLKIRKGNIENFLIYYNRSNQKDSKKSEIELYPLLKHSYLEKITRNSHEVLVEVDKIRKIYFIDNVKFHLDNVKGLGRFIEIEAISKDDSLSEEKIKGQCDYYKNLFKIKNSDLISESYSDMILNLKKEN